jgi:hypothetical protein
MDEASSAERPEQRPWSLHALYAELQDNAGDLAIHIWTHWRLILGLAASERLGHLARGPAAAARAYRAGALRGARRARAAAAAWHGRRFRWLWSAGIRPTENSFGAAVYANRFSQGLHAAITTVMALYLVARVWAGLIDPVRRVTFDNIRLFWFYTVVQALAGMALTHLFPRGLPV